MVTGASSGIGEATARLLAERGATVICTSEREPDLKRVTDSIRDAGGNAVPVVVDFSKPEAVDGLIEKLETNVGPIDVLINNAGVGMRAQVTERPFADTRFVLEVNFFAVASLCSQLLPRMYSRNSGRIINVSSAAGQFGCAGMSAYSASKGAIHAYSQAVRVEALAHNVYISEVVPISVRTAFFQNVRGKTYKPLGIVLTVESVAKCIVNCAERNKPAAEVWPYFWIRMVFILNAFFPGLFVKLNFRTFKRNLNEHGESIK